MARIRSIHPGIWTDEGFMALSAHARLLLIGLWNEAFDDGVFEWKPLTLKARIFPVDAVIVDDLLAEVEAVGFIRPAYSPDGEKRIGLIRNFQRFQRPKKPNSSGMLPDEWREYVGLKGDSSEPVPNQFRTSGEKSPQMEDGGWNRKGKEDYSAADAASSSRYAFEHGVIRLNSKDLEKWRDAYPLLHLEAELYQLSEWAGRDHPKNWFHAVSAALAKRNRQQAAALEKARAEGAARGSPRSNVIDAADALNTKIRERYNAEPDAERHQYALPSPDRW